MSFLALGVEHRTASLAVREAAAMDAGGVADAAATLLAAPSIDEIAILSTCNRTELYVHADGAGDAADIATAFFRARDASILPHLQIWRDMEAVDHLFRVACGLESQAVGERQIVAQVRAALSIAEDAGTIGPHLHSLFRSAISCARQARAGTELGQVETSIGATGVLAAEEVLGSLEGCAALVVGAGEVSRLVLQELRHRGTGRLFVANRTESVAVALAAEFRATAVRMDDVTRLFTVVDLVVSATGSPHYVLVAEDVRRAVTQRPQPLVIVDLAIPRDIDPAIGEFPGIQLLDLDDLIPDALAESWRDDIRSMEAVIAAEVKEFQTWYLTRRVVPVISSLRAHVEAVSAQELRRVAPQLAGLNAREQAAVESLTNRLIDKMFHHLVMRLRLAAQSDPKLVEAAEFFFLHGEGGLFEHAARDESRVLSSES